MGRQPEVLLGRSRLAWRLFQDDLRAIVSGNGKMDESEVYAFDAVVPSVSGKCVVSSFVFTLVNEIGSGRLSHRQPRIPSNGRFARSRRYSS